MVEMKRWLSLRWPVSKTMHIYKDLRLYLAGIYQNNWFELYLTDFQSSNEQVLEIRTHMNMYPKSLPILWFMKMVIRIYIGMFSTESLNQYWIVFSQTVWCQHSKLVYLSNFWKRFSGEILFMWVYEMWNEYTGTQWKTCYRMAWSVKTL